MEKKKTHTSNAVKDRWKAENYTRINIYLDKNVAAAYKEKCSKEGLNFSDIPKEAITKYLRGE